MVEQVLVARDTYRLRLDSPSLAQSILPGQFLMIRPAVGTDPLLGRPFALYDIVRDASGVAWAVDVVYLVLGRGTAELTRRLPGDRLSVWGPLGNGFGSPPRMESHRGSTSPVTMVAGGIGQTPFLALAKWWTRQENYGIDEPNHAPHHGPFRLDYGVRGRDLLACVDDFRAWGVEVEIATDDGSIGHKGYVTDLLARRLKSGEPVGKVLGCGPAPMLASLARLADQHALDCDVSLENHMACGFGACFSCVAPIRQEDGSTDLKRVCVEGPVFPARRVVWDAPTVGH